MEPAKITITIELVEHEEVDPSLANRDRVAEDIIEHIEKLPHSPILNVDTYDFIRLHRHQEFKVRYY